ncbi:MAG: RsmB/NOP family class I SAM-dependent RNA methyltransferase, partial [Polyangia bacterium]|nr:RsmB/NOP family class I SAM-dependent RNA methyltransferase [Polyangia bacterium]
MTSPSLLSYYDRYRELVDDWPAFLASLSAPLPICLWTNRLRIAPEALAERLTAEAGLPPHPVSWYPGAFRWPEASSRGPQGLELPRPGLTTSHAQGLFTLQEEAAMLPVLLLAPRPGERILDLCAAPGNKTAQLAVAVGQAGTVVANDLHWARVSPLRRIQERLGLLNLVATAGNGVTFPADERGGLYDAVLVDVPCSCDATLRKNPKVPLGQDDERRSRTAGV